MPSFLKAKPRLPTRLRIDHTEHLLYAPTRNVLDGALSDFFTKERLRNLLKGSDMPICRHIHFGDDLVIDSFRPCHGVIDRNLCHPRPLDERTCCCCRSDTTWGSGKCKEINCITSFELLIIHKNWECSSYPSGPCEMLTLGISKTFLGFDADIDPTWTGSLYSLSEANEITTAVWGRWLNRLSSYDRENRSWYDQAVRDAAHRTLATAPLNCDRNEQTSEPPPPYDTPSCKISL